MTSILTYFPDPIRSALRPYVLNDTYGIEEIRLRPGKNVEICGRTVHELPVLFTESCRHAFLSHITSHSLYRLEEQIKRGYITVAGGHRIGFAGQAVLRNGEVAAMEHLAFFNIRLAKEKKGIAEPLARMIYHERWHSTLLIGPPQSGKTTLLRDIARLCGSGSADRSIAPVKTIVIDERSELAGCLNGVPQLDVGTRTDVLDACPKSEGMMMMIRSMSPDVLVADEIGRPEDTAALEEALNAGVAVMASVHAESLSEAARRPVIERIIQAGLFRYYVVLNRNKRWTVQKEWVTA